jgi:hypothetical protein
MELEIRIPGQISTNDIYSSNPFSLGKVKHAFYEEVAYGCGKLSPITVYPVRLVFTFYLTGRRYDWVNCAGMAKMIEDGLRLSGVLKNDSPPYVSQGTIRVEKSKRKYPYCILEVVENFAA